MRKWDLPCDWAVDISDRQIGGVKKTWGSVLATAKEMQGKEQGTAKKLQGPRGG